MPSPILLSVAEVLEKVPGSDSSPVWVNPGFTGIVRKILSTESKTTRKPMQIVTIGDTTGSAEISMTIFRPPTALPFREHDEIEVFGAIRRTEFRGLQEVSIGQDTEIHVIRSGALTSKLPFDREAAEPPAAGRKPDPKQAALPMAPATPRMVEIAIEGAVRVLIQKSDGGAVSIVSLREDVIDVAGKILSAARQIASDEKVPF